jgi:hypothetical protein
MPEPFAARTRFWHPCGVLVLCACPVPGVFASLRPPATFWQPFGLLPSTRAVYYKDPCWGAGSMLKTPDNLADGRHTRPANNPPPARQTQENTRQRFLTPLAQRPAPRRDGRARDQRTPDRVQILASQLKQKGPEGSVKLGHP